MADDIGPGPTETDSDCAMVTADMASLDLDAAGQRKKIVEKLDLTYEEKKEVLTELERPKKYGLMVCGLTGVGKSTLLNGIIGENIFKEGDELQHETMEVYRHEMIDGSCKLILCDTPGFYDDTGDESTYLTKIRDKCQDINSLLYCISIRSSKTSLQKDLDTIKKLRTVLSDNVWNQAIVVLTFSNHVVNKLVAKKESNLEKKFNERIEDWKKVIKSTLINAGISEILVDEIPMVPAGAVSTPSLLSDADYWFSTLWYALSDRATDDGQVVLSQINSKRLQTRTKESIEGLTAKTLSQQPILPPKTWLDNLKVKHPTIGAAVGVGSVAGATGATVGAVIGALAIGIPSFGIAAGLGLVLGAAIGGGAGIGVGVVTGKAIEVVKKRKAREANTEREEAQTKQK